MKKILLSGALLVMMGASVFAQTKENKRGPYETNRLFDNVYIGVAGGINLYNGDHDAAADFGDRVGFALDATLGKWVTPCVGVRLQYNGLKIKGATSVDGLKNPYAGAALSGTTNRFEKEIKYNGLFGDVMWNISNAIGGYKETRFWNFIPFAGFGGIQAKNSDGKAANEEWAFRLGLLNNLRLSDAFDLTLETRYMITNDRFDGLVDASAHEGMFSATVGICYNFKKNTWKRAEKAIVPDYSSYNNRISDLERQLSDAEALNKKLADELAEARKVKPTASNKVVAGALAVFFNINKYNLTDKEYINLENIAKVIKESGKKYTISGYADKETGNATINKALGQKRAEVVYNALVKNYGVDAKQLEVVNYGDTKAPFSKPVLNRVTIVE